MIDLAIQNFRNIREARLIDDQTVSVIVGMNESGKSSLIGAIKFAMTGTAFDRKVGATADGLVTYGEQSMTVRVLVGNTLVTRTRSGGDSLKSVAERLGVTSELLPLMFDSKMCGDGGSKAMRAFLDGAASSAFDPLTHFSTDPPIYELVMKARSAGKLTTKAIIDYCESMRGQCKVPTAPVLPGFARPIPNHILQAREAMAKAQTLERDSIAEYTDSTLLGHKLARLVQYKSELVTYEKQRAAASMVDALGNKRQALQKVLSINLQTIDAIAHILQDAGFNPTVVAVLAAGKAVSEAMDSARATLAVHLAPATMPNPPQLDDETFQVALALGNPTAASPVEAVGHFSDQALRDLLTTSATSSNEIKAVLTLNSVNARQLENNYQELLKMQGAYEAYDRSVPAYEENKLSVEAQWQRWDTAAKTIAAAETQHVNKSGDVFGQLVSDFSASILQGRKLKVSRDEGIFLGRDRIEDCAESTQWRIEASILAAVGVMLKSPLLLLDGADILDPVNKMLVQQFLITNIAPRFRHVIVTTTTARPLEEELPAEQGCGVTKWIINNGQLRKL